MLYTDATLGNMLGAVNRMKEIGEAYSGKANIIFYYAGHGIPDESSRSALLLPVDGNGRDSSTGYSLSSLYKSLGSMPTQSVLVLLDACFSGTQRDGTMMKAARGIAIKAKATSPSNNMIVLSASQGDETAGAYNDKHHGLFTYFLLKKLQETSGEATLSEIGNYISEQVSQQVAIQKGRKQTPLTIPSATYSGNWKETKLK